MSVADDTHPRTTDAAPVLPPSRPVGRPPLVPASRPAGAGCGHGMDRDTGRSLAVALAFAWLLCPAVEPLPDHEMPYALWQLPIDLAAVASLVAAVVALWRGSRSAARLVLVAGVLMAVETIVCPLAGHTTVGWWTWVQTSLSLVVMATGVVLHRVRRS